MDTLVAESRNAIRVGSKSFSAAARLFDARTRDSAYMLYAWCRHCDDVIDGQVLGHGGAAPPRGDTGEVAHTRGERLAGLYRETRRALAGEAVSDPVFAAFQRVALAHRLPAHLPIELLEGFAMDVGGRQYATLEDTLVYCYHVAGVVGRMMAIVMGVREAEALHRATDLGIAFQLTNIARDVIDDHALGRIYLPGDWLAGAGITPANFAAPARRPALARVVARLLDTSEPYYASGRIGLSALPFRSAWAIATALGVYREIGWRVRQRGARAWDERVVVPRSRKLLHVADGVRYALLASLRGITTNRAPSRAGLWTRPLDPYR
jgi:phytoene synthase